MANIIQILPDHVANQIAAGEVVQRPASVVKELLENSIDAGASQINLIIRNAGKTLVQVIDNGNGMSASDARLSFERHATSKITSADDLFCLNTNGFRGEALASIAAIAHVELKTKLRGESLGSSLKIEGSKLKSEDVVSTSEGTSVAVKNLFFNIPARRNFLKSDPVELRHIMDEFHRVAMAHPQINFSMHHNVNDLFDLRSESFRQRIIHIFGAKMNEKLLPVQEDTELLKISGFVGKPEFAKKSRGEQFFFVNHRFIKSSYLNHAILSAFEGLLLPNKYPSYFLNLEVDPKSIDINIHPTKTEIKFDDEPTLYALLRAAVKHSLGQFSIAPALDFERDASMDTPYDQDVNKVSSPKVEVDPSFNPFRTQTKAAPKSNVSDWEGLYMGLESKSNSDFNPISEAQFESDALQSSIFEKASIKNTQSTFQLQNKYIVGTIKSGLVVIDQNRAHERILYEDYLQQITLKEPVSQQLLFPLRLEFSTQELAIIKNIKPQLVQAGFKFSAFDTEALELTALPVGVQDTFVSKIFDQLISDVHNEVPDFNFSQSDLLAKSIAKSLATKNGKKLSIQEQEFIINALFACKEPTVTPYNKTIFITIDGSYLDSKFN